MVNFNVICHNFRVHAEPSADSQGLDLVFRSIDSEDEGEYACEAIIDGRKEQQFFELKVIGEFEFSRLFFKKDEKVTYFQILHVILS